MKRLPHQPCRCESLNVVVKDGRVVSFGCKQCALAATVKEMNLAWGGDGCVLEYVPPPIQAKPKQIPDSIKCRFRDDTGKSVGKATCAEGCVKEVNGKPEPVMLPLRWCSKFKEKVVVAKTTHEGYRCCRDCKANGKGWEPPVAEQRISLPMQDSQRLGVVVGSYKWPSLVALQIETIRATCGNVPICVSSDDPGSSAVIDSICSQHPDVFHWPNWNRIGHTGGDISAFFKGVIWGASRGLKVVAKLSQRFLITRPNWLSEGAEALLASNLAIATQRCRGTQRFDLRTEACLIDVRQWNTPDVLARIVPRPYWKDSPKGITAETVISRVLQDLLGEFFWPWSLFGEDRSVKSPGVVWHNSNGKKDYQNLAAQYGIELDSSFHIAGWQQDLAAGVYQLG